MVKKVLVINPFGIGDVIFSMALVQALKNFLPQVSIGFLGNERTMGLLGMNRLIDVRHEFNRDELRALRRKNLFLYVSRFRSYWKELKKQGYDTVFDLSMGREFAFAAFLLGIPRRIGLDYKKRGFFLTHRTVFQGYEEKSVADWQLSLLRHIGLDPDKAPSFVRLSVSPESESQAKRWLADQSAISGKRFFILAPGGGRSWGDNAVYKQWSPARFAETGNRWGQSRGYGVLLAGDDKEEDLLREVKAGLSVPSAIVSGQRLEVVAALMKRAEILVGNDGGLVHLANALGVKTVSLYGPVDEKVYGPYGNQTAHEVLSEPVECRPCYRRFHFPVCEHQRRCLEELSTEKVLAAMQKIS